MGKIIKFNEMNDNTLAGYHFTIKTDEMGTNIFVASDVDYQAGFEVSYELPQNIMDYLESIGCFELMEGVFETSGAFKAFEAATDIKSKGGIIH